MDDPASFTILEDGKPMSGHKVLGRFVKLHHMGHVPEPYLPATLIGTIYLKLPRPMEEGKTYVFRSRGIGSKGVNATLQWSFQNVLSDAIKVNQVGYLPDSRIRFAYLGKWLGTGGALDAKADAFEVIDLSTGKVAYEGKVRLRRKAGDKTEGATSRIFLGNAYGSTGPAWANRGPIASVFPASDGPIPSVSAQTPWPNPCSPASERSITPDVASPCITSARPTRNACRQHQKIAVYPEYGKSLDFKSIDALKNAKASGTLRYRTSGVATMTPWTTTGDPCTSPSLTTSVGSSK